MADSLGLCFQDSKVEGPTTCLEFLGIELDSHAMEACLPSRKLEFLSSLLPQWKSKTHCTLLELQELTGYLQFCSQVIPYSRAFLCSFFNFTSTFKSDFSHCRIPRSTRRDLEWWIMYSSSWKGIHFVALTHPVIHIYTDASCNGV